MKKLITMFLLSLSLISINFNVNAKEYTVKMYTKGPNGKNMFDPPLLKIKLGDTVKWIPTEKGHNTSSVKKGVPKGVKWKSKINKEFSFTFEKDGTYIYECVPHKAMGMVGAVLVGDYKVNFEKVQKKAKLKKKGKIRMNQYFKDAGIDATFGKKKK